MIQTVDHRLQKLDIVHPETPSPLGGEGWGEGN
jgi:hypothetical protein